MNLDILKIGVINPVYLKYDKVLNWNGYNVDFFNKYVKVIYLSNCFEYKSYKRYIKYHNLNVKIIWNVKKLNMHTNMLISFNGLPFISTRLPLPNFLKKYLALKFYSFPKKYKRIKILHIMDYFQNSEYKVKNFQNWQIDYYLAYGNNLAFPAVYSQLNLNNISVLPVYFGHSTRYYNYKKIEERIPKAILLGNSGVITYENREILFHPIRNEIIKNLYDYDRHLDSLQGQRDYNPVEKFNDYMFFINDLSFCNFPPAKTFEGIACGCILIGKKDKTYDDLGFVDGENCILIEDFNSIELNIKIEAYLENYKKLKTIQENSIKLSSEFTHSKISDNLYTSLYKKVTEFS